MYYKGTRWRHYEIFLGFRFGDDNSCIIGCAFGTDSYLKYMYIHMCITCEILFENQLRTWLGYIGYLTQAHTATELK